jgi:hypothetical protein
MAEKAIQPRGFVPADKLVLLCDVVKKDFQRVAQDADEPRGGYSYFVDLQNTQFRLPVRLYCDGKWNGINKIEFVGVAALGLRRAEEIVNSICEDPPRAKITRIDWAVDVLGLSAWDLGASCRVANVVNSEFYHSRGGVSFYPHRSNTRSILIYERGKHLSAQHHPDANRFTNRDLTRLEVQFKGKGVPIREFSRIREYKDIDVLRGVSFERIVQIPNDLKPLQILQAEGLRSLVSRLGLQNASKRFAPSEWAYIRKKYLRPSDGFPDLRFLMKREVEDWLRNVFRFPRC